MTNPDAPIAVIGGGLAGLAAALDLAEAGLPTLLIERRPFVGGKAFSFRDPQHGVELDNGQHITMRCCTALQALMERVGCDDIVRYQPGLRVPVIDPANSADGVNPLSADLAASRPRLLRWLTWSPSPIPAPLHLASSVLAYPHLSLIERLNLGRALLPMRRMSESQRRGLDRTSFGAWLRQQGQSDRAIERFWDLIILPTCNDRCDRVSAAQAMQVFRDGFLFDSRAGDIGLFRRGLGEVAQAALTRFRDLGGRALLGRAIDSVEISGGDAVGVRFSLGDPIPIRGAILALPPHRALELLPDAWRKRETLLAARPTPDSGHRQRPTALGPTRLRRRFRRRARFPMSSSSSTARACKAGTVRGSGSPSRSAARAICWRHRTTISPPAPLTGSAAPFPPPAMRSSSLPA